MHYDHGRLPAGAEIIEDSGGALVKTTSDSGKINTQGFCP